MSTVRSLYNITFPRKILKNSMRRRGRSAKMWTNMAATLRTIQARDYDELV